MTECNLFVSVPFVNGGAAMTENTYDHVKPTVKRAYLEALLGEAEGFVRDAETLCVRSLTLGTGSVSTLPEQELGMLLKGLKRCFSLNADTPIYAIFDPGLLTVGQANRLRETGRFLPQFRYFTTDAVEACALGIPCGEVEMGKTDQLLEQVGVADIGMQIALALPCQTEQSLETTLRRALRGTTERFCLMLPSAGVGEAQAPRAVALYECARQWLEAHGFVEDCLMHFSRGGETDPYDIGYYGGADEGEPGTLCLGPSTVSCVGGLLWSNTGDMSRYIESRGNAELITEGATAVEAPTRTLRQILNRLYRGDAAPVPDAVACRLEDSRLFEERDSGLALSPWGRLRHRDAFALLAERFAEAR